MVREALNHPVEDGSFRASLRTLEGTMYLSIGNDLAIREANLIGIFDLDNTSTAYKTREFLSKCEENGEIVPCDELPKSFILTQEYGFNRIYLSSLNVTTLEKRIKGRVVPQNQEVLYGKRKDAGGAAV